MRLPAPTILTPTEIADFCQRFGLRGFPLTAQGWKAQLKNLVGETRLEDGKRGYRLESLPSAFIQTFKDDSAKFASLKGRPSVTTDARRRSCRIELVGLFQKNRAPKIPIQAAACHFCKAYNKGFYQVDPKITAEFEILASGTLMRWYRLVESGDTKSLGGNYGNRKGKGIFNVAFGGEVKRDVDTFLFQQSHLAAHAMLELIMQKYGNEEWEVEGGEKKTLPAFPSFLRAFQTFVKARRKTRQRDLALMASPQKARSSLAPAVGKRDEWVRSPNDLWLVDGSPADILCLIDGFEVRLSAIALLDVYSRRAMVELSEQNNQAATLRVIRRAMLAWGKPKFIKTDNGKEYSGQHFTGALEMCGIKQIFCQPYQPEQKAKVERFIRTLQHSCFAQIEGFTGANVSEREKIRDRRTFADRRGLSREKIYNVQHSREELQRLADQFCLDIYGNNKHSSLGVSPNEKAMVSAEKPVLVDESELAILFAPIPDKNGIRVVGKEGIQVLGVRYWHEICVSMIGEKVLVKYDPEDLGKIHLFRPETSTKICTAINAESLGEDRQKLAERANQIFNAQQRDLKAEIKREKDRVPTGAAAQDALASMRRGDRTVLPFPASKGARPKKIALINKATGNSAWHEKKDAAEFQSRISRAKELLAAMDLGDQISEEDEGWLATYRTSPEYKTYLEPQLAAANAAG